MKAIVQLAFGFGDSELDNDTMQNKSIFFVRSFYAAMFLTDRDNHTFLSKTGTEFISQLFKNIYLSFKETVVVNNLHLIIHLYTFYLNMEPTIFCYNFLKYRLANQLLYNLDKSFVVDFLISLINPFDMMQGIPSKHLTLIWKDFGLCNFFLDVSSVMLRGPDGITEDKFDRNYLNSEMEVIIKSFEPHIDKCENKISPLLILLKSFSQEKFAEDMLRIKIDIDQIKLIKPTSKSKRSHFQSKTRSMYEQTPFSKIQENPLSKKNTRDLESLKYPIATPGNVNDFSKMNKYLSSTRLGLSNNKGFKDVKTERGVRFSKRLSFAEKVSYFLIYHLENYTASKKS